MLDEAAEIRHNLNTETAPIAWSELERHFARGAVIHVDGSLNLLDVGVAFTKDDQMRVKGWLNGGEVGPLSTELAKDWASEERNLWAVVIAPWILVQDRGAADGDTEAVGKPDE
ncbi:MAG: DUF2288 domain-containing protein [bacterium]